MLAASTATGQLIFLPLAAWLIEHLGWRYAVLPVFVACLVVAAAGAAVHAEPAERRRLALLRRARRRRAASRAAGADRISGPRSPSSREAARNRTFWILAGTFFICGLSTNGLVQTHFISLCSDNGLSVVPAASVLSMMGVFDLVGTTLSGYLSDRFDNRKLLFWYYGLRGLSLFWLPYSTFTLYGLSMFALFYGLDWIATVPPTVKLAAQAFGRERAGLVFGWVFAAHQLGAATAAYGAGLTRTLLLTYNPALFTAGAACLVAAVAILAIGRPKRAGACPPRPEVPSPAETARPAAPRGRRRPLRRGAGTRRAPVHPMDESKACSPPSSLQAPRRPSMRATPSWRFGRQTATRRPSKPSCGGTTGCSFAPRAAFSGTTTTPRTRCRRRICAPGARSQVFAPKPKVSTWLVRIVVNEALGRLRRRGAQVIPHGCSHRCR